jgi:beta-aspartyl-peptidase (threonine type)
LTAVQNPAGDPVAGVRVIWTAQVDAWNRGDLEGFMTAYWKSPDLVFFSNGGTTRGWQATLERYRAKYQGEKKEMGKLDFPELEFVALGPDAALARGRWHLRMPDGQEYTGMTSVIFRRLPEGWRIVHDHSSTA